MPINKRNRQIGIKVETVEGTEEALVAADFSGNRKEGSHRDSHNRYQRNLDRGTATKMAELASMYQGALSWVEEFVGGSASTAAPWHATLQGLGFKKTAVKYYQLSATTAGAAYIGLKVGNNAILANATKIGYIVGIFSSGSLVIYRTTGADFNVGEHIFGYDGAAAQYDATVSNSFAAGFTFSPQTEDDTSVPPSVTCETRLGGQRHTRIGARGDGGISIKQGEPLLLRANFTGIPVYTSAAARTPRLGGVVAGVTQYSTAPKVGQGIPFILRTGPAATYTPVMTELNIEFGNQIAPRSTITNVDLQSSGYLPTRIADRDIVARIEPEHVLPAAGFDFIGTLNTGAVFQLNCQVGDSKGTHGQVALLGRQVQLSGDLENGDREGIVTDPLSVGFFGDFDDELLVTHIFEPGIEP